MKFIYNDKEFKVDLSKYARRKKNKSSKPHQDVLKSVSDKYSHSIIIEEFPLLGIKPKLYLDIFLPREMIAIEVDGEQHYEYIDFFYSNKLAFAKAKSNDRKKEDWCQQNQIELIRIRYKDWNGEL